MRLITFLALFGFIFSQSPLVELSKKEKERRKKVKSVKVITNADLGKVPKPNLVVSGGSVGKVYTEEVSEGKSASKGRKWWASRKKALEEKIAKLQREIKELQAKINSLNTTFLVEQRPFAHLKVKTELEKAKGRLERAKKELEQAKKALEDLYEQARKQGVPPGWLR